MSATALTAQPTLETRFVDPEGQNLVHRVRGWSRGSSLELQGHRALPQSVQGESLSSLGDRPVLSASSTLSASSSHADEHSGLQRIRYPVVTRSPDRVTRLDRRAPSTCKNNETCGRGPWHGQETVPQHRSGDRATTGVERNSFPTRASMD